MRNSAGPWAGDETLAALTRLPPADALAGGADLTRPGTARNAALAWAAAAGPEGVWLLDGRDAVAAQAQDWWLWLPARTASEPAPASAWPMDEEAGWRLGAEQVLHAPDADAWRAALQRRRWQQQALHGPRARRERLLGELQALRASLDNIPAPIFVKDANGRYTECNRAFLAYLGRRREEIIGKTVWDVAPPAQAVVYAEADRQLLAAGGQQIYDAQVRWSDGSLRDVTVHKAVFHDAHGDPAGQAGAIFDVTERRLLEQRLRSLAETDPLTGLLNRRSFIERAARALDQAALAQQSLAMLVFDIDHFKQVNNRHGHAAGDAMLCHLAQVIGQQLRARNLFARLGGDEFAVLLAGPAEAHAVAQRLPAQVAARPLVMEAITLPCRISLGGAVLPPGSHTVDAALNRADVALYEAKRQGRNQAVCV